MYPFFVWTSAQHDQDSKPGHSAYWSLYSGNKAPVTSQNCVYLAAQFCEFSGGPCCYQSKNYYFSDIYRLRTTFYINIHISNFIVISMYT